MKLIKIFLALFIISSVTALAQNRTTIRIKAGDDAGTAPLISSIYSFSEFSSGRVYFKDGSVSSARLNYNHFINDFEFIGAKGDTLTIVDKLNLASIKVLGKTFVYDGRFLEIINQSSRLLLAKRMTISLTNKEKKSAFGVANYTSDIESFETIERTKQYKLQPNEHLIYTKKVELFFATGTEFLSSTERNLYRLYPKDRDRLSAYVREAKVDFKDEIDLGKLCQFIEKEI